MLRMSYFFVVLFCIVPTLLGLLGAVFSSFGYIPPLKMLDFRLEGYALVFAWEGVSYSIFMSFYTALFSTFFACFMTFLIVQSSWETRFWRYVETALSPLLAMPHVAFAIGFSFLFAPTGMGMRVWDGLFGGDAAAQGGGELATLVNDPYGLGMILLLTLKEIPFLLLMSLSVLPQIRVKEIEKVCASLGYTRAQAWWKCIFVQWLIKLRFPLFAVMAYGLSVVDVALILGPTNPPTFAVLVWQWFNDPDLSLLPRAGAGALVLFALSLLLMGLTFFLIWLVTRAFPSWQYAGKSSLCLPGKPIFIFLSFIALLMLPLMLLWSVAQRWRFPDLLPSQYSLRFWQFEWDSILSAVDQSLAIALISASLSLLLAIIAHEYRIRHRLQVPAYIIAMPMLLPQLSLLFGLQVGTLSLHGISPFFWVCWGHVFFSFPYVYLSLDGPWRSFDSRLTKAALSLGKSPLRVWFKVKMPILLPAIGFAWAMGISVSLAQYLPTLVLGGGRVSTLTTEAVALSSGFDRRVTAIYALCLTLLPLLFFSLALLMRHLQIKYRRSSAKGFISNVSLS